MVPTRFRQLEILWKTNGGSGFPECTNVVAGNLIKPMHFLYFWSRKSKMGSGIIGKALPREGFRNAFPTARNP